jgi:hypothetical protein
MKEIDMTRREGPKGVALVELASKRKQKYIVRTDLQPYQTEESTIPQESPTAVIGLRRAMSGLK